VLFEVELDGDRRFVTFDYTDYFDVTFDYTDYFDARRLLPARDRPHVGLICVLGTVRRTWPEGTDELEWADLRHPAASGTAAPLRPPPRAGRGARQLDGAETACRSSRGSATSDYLSNVYHRARLARLFLPGRFDG
jgi:hypothetical protein